MAEFTKEQLINLARENVRVLKQATMQHKVQPVIAMDLRLAEIALAALKAGMEQEPVSGAPELSKVLYHFRDWNEGFPVERFKADYVIGWMLENYPPAPQLPQPAVVIPLGVAWEDVPEEITEDDMGLASAWEHGFNQCRAAMLQGAETVSQPYTLRDGVAAIRSLGGIDAGKIQAERDALNEPTCWCRTCRPVTVDDMRFVVCPECGNKRCPRANDCRSVCTGSNKPGQEGSAYPAAPQQEVE